MLTDGPRRAYATVVLAHGAGAPMDSPFLNQIAERLARAKLRVVRFEFPYMAEARRSGKRRAPDREAKLLDAWRAVAAAVAAGGAETLVVGGKSLGGRIASMVADEIDAAGLVCLGYPFHPPGRPDRLRTDHLRKLRTPALILQGTRDSFGKPDEVEGYELSPAIEVHWLLDGDHSFKPRARSGRSEEDNLAEACDRIAAFVAGLGRSS